MSLPCDNVDCPRPGRVRIPAEENACDDGSPGDPVTYCDECWRGLMGTLAWLSTQYLLDQAASYLEVQP